VVMLNPAMVTMSRTIFNHIKSELETDVRAALAGRETDPAKLRYAQELHKVRESTSTSASMSTLEQHSAWIPGAKRHAFLARSAQGPQRRNDHFWANGWQATAVAAIDHPPGVSSEGRGREGGWKSYSFHRLEESQGGTKTGEFS